MANHAQVQTGRTLDPMEVNDLVQQINRDRFGDLFTLDFQVDVEGGWGKYQWILSYKDDPYMNIEFWLSSEVEYPGRESTKVIVSEQSVIEFRHGHSYQFMWYVEAVFRETLGHHYSARMWDDGLGPTENMPKEHFSSFENFICNDLDRVEEKDIIKRRKNMYFMNADKQIIPKEIVEKLNLDFKI